MQILLVISLLFAALVAIFALQNAQTVPIKFFMWQPEASIAVIVLLFAAAGAFIAAIIGIVRQVRLGLRLRNTKTELARTSKALEATELKLKEVEGKVKILEEQFAPRIITVSPTRVERDTSRDVKPLPEYTPRHPDDDGNKHNDDAMIITVNDDETTDDDEKDGINEVEK